MPQSTTTDADSSIPIKSFSSRQRQDTLLGAFCSTTRDTMPQSTTTDADSSIPITSFILAQRQDMLLGAFCSTTRDTMPQSTTTDADSSIPIHELHTRATSRHAPRCLLLHHEGYHAAIDHDRSPTRRSHSRASPRATSRHTPRCLLLPRASPRATSRHAPRCLLLHHEGYHAAIDHDRRPTRPSQSRASARATSRHAPRCLLLHHEGYHASIDHDRRRLVDPIRELRSSRNVQDTLLCALCSTMRDTMPQSTTTDADSPIPITSFILAQRQDTLLGCLLLHHEGSHAAIDHDRRRLVDTNHEIQLAQRQDTLLGAFLLHHEGYHAAIDHDRRRLVDPNHELHTRATSRHAPRCLLLHHEGYHAAIDHDQTPTRRSQSRASARATSRHAPRCLLLHHEGYHAAIDHDRRRLVDPNHELHSSRNGIKTSRRLSWSPCGMLSTMSGYRRHRGACLDVARAEARERDRRVGVCRCRLRHGIPHGGAEGTTTERVLTLREVLKLAQRDQDDAPRCLSCSIAA